MAKRKPSETNLPLIISLVFFVLTTIGLGVFCYVLYSDMESKDAEVAKAKDEVKKLRDQKDEAVQIARVQRVYFGVPNDDDLAGVEADVKPGTAAYNHLEKLIQETQARTTKLGAATAKRFEEDLNKAVENSVEQTIDARKKDPKAPVIGVKLDLSKVNYNEDLGFWKPAINPATGGLSRPTGSMLDVIVRSKIQRDIALQQSVQDRNGYEKGVQTMTTATTDAQKARQNYNNQADALPKKFNDDLAELQADFARRKADFDKKELASRTEIASLKDQIAKANNENRRLKDEVTDLNGKLDALVLRTTPKADPLKYDEARGHVTKRFADKTVEIDLGSNDRVREGLTFSVLPREYRVQGEQSRMREIRIPDGRGGFKSEVVFVPKATIEVIEVLGPTSSRAKITDEMDPVRDGAMPGDLLYSAAWRPGAPEHIALIGIFDVNGDGADDIDQVVRDFRKMGVLVDAWYNPLKNNGNMTFGGWEGTINDQTRYIVKGYFPDPINDATREKMSELNGKLKAALEDAKRSGAQVVGIKEFFPRMGYKIRMDVTDDQVRQAARRYLDPGAGPMPGKKDN
jgi:hypothetical protein